MQLPQYPRYESYKDSGVEWLGEVPQGWQTIRLKYVSQEQNQKVAASTVQDRYVGMENVESWSGRLVETASEVEGLANVFASQDILFGKLRPYLAKVHLAERSGICSSEFMVLRFGENVSRRFYFYALISNAFIGLVNASTYGSKMPRANPGFVNNREIPVPPLEEQQAIARFLDDKTDKIDRAVKIKEGQIALLRERKQIIIQEAVTKGLNPDAPMKDSGIDWIGEIPVHWEVKRFKHKFRSAMGETILAQDLKDGGSIPVYSATEGDHFFGFVDSTSIDLRPGDLVIPARGNSIGFPKLVSERATCSQTTIYASKFGDITSLFVFYYLWSNKQFLFQFVQTAIPQITVDEVKNNFLLVPPKVEQERIVDYCDRQSGKIEDAIKLKQRQIVALKEYKATLINAAVTGKIKVI